MSAAGTGTAYVPVTHRDGGIVVEPARVLYPQHHPLYVTDDTRHDRFWELICGFDVHLWIGFSLTAVLLILSVGTFFFVERGSGSYVIVQIDILILTTLLLGITVLLRQCSERNYMN